MIILGKVGNIRGKTAIKDILGKRKDLSKSTVDHRKYRTTDKLVYINVCNKGQLDDCESLEILFYCRNKVNISRGPIPKSRVVGSGISP